MVTQRCAVLPKTDQQPMHRHAERATKYVATSMIAHQAGSTER